MSRLLLKSLFFTSFAISTLAQTQVSPTEALQTSDSVTVTIPPFTNQVRRVVAFLRVKFDQDGESRYISGTAFFVSMPDPRLGKGSGFTYLVTNRHMAVPGAESGHSYPVKDVLLSVNRRNMPGIPDSLVEMSLGANVPWYFPSDPSVDLAVTPIYVASSNAQSVPLDIFATHDVVHAQQISPGDQVLFAGYFYQFPGIERVQPIVRQGVLAMMPDEPIKTTLQLRGNMYLADIHAFHGNSGSPIFVNTGGLRIGHISQPYYMLLGVVSGYYPESQTDFSIPAARVLTGEVRDNSGVTTVVPSDELKALLESQDLMRLRDAYVTQFLGHNR